MRKENKGYIVYGVYKKDVEIRGNFDFYFDETILSENIDIYDFDEFPYLDEVRDYYNEDIDEGDKTFDELTLEEQVEALNNYYEFDEYAFCVYFTDKEEAQEFYNRIEEDTTVFNDKFDEALENGTLEFLRYSSTEYNQFVKVYIVVNEE